MSPRYRCAVSCFAGIFGNLHTVHVEATLLCSSTSIFPRLLQTDLIRVDSQRRLHGLIVIFGTGIRLL